MFENELVPTKDIIVKPILSLDLSDESLIVNKPNVGIRGKVIDAKTMWLNEEEIWCNDLGFFYKVMPLGIGRNLFKFNAISRTGHETGVVKYFYRMY